MVEFARGIGARADRFYNLLTNRQAAHCASPEAGEEDAMTAVPTLNVIGCGRVGRSLARLFHCAGAARIQDLCARKTIDAESAAHFVGAGRAVTAVETMRSADVWMLSVPDMQIAQAAADLAARPASAHAVAFHCSGFHPAAILQPLSEQGWRCASVHPVLSFASPETAIERFRGTPCGIEGDAGAVSILQSTFAAIGGVCFPVAGDRKALYHAAAVFANNFTVVLQAIAREAWRASGVPDELAERIHAALLRATAENAIALGADAITGPAARGDHDVVDAQATAVARWHPEAGVLYRDLSALARRLAVQRSTVPGEPR